jgi:cathepsin B
MNSSGNKNTKKSSDVEKERLEDELKKKQEDSRNERESKKQEKINEAIELEKRKVVNQENAEEVQKKLMKKKTNPYFYYYVTFGVLGAITVYVIVMLFLNQSTPLDKVLTIDEQKIEEHNHSYPWKQGPNKFFEGSTLSDAKKLISSTFASHSNLARCGVDDTVVSPDHFDYRTQWQACVLPVRNQQNTCGSGYAIAVAQTASERLCIASKAQKLVNLSAQELLSCDKNNHGCKSGFLNNSADYLKNTGLVDEACFPYSVDSTCDKMCAEPKRHKTDGYCILFGEEDIKREILKNGPVFSVMTIYVDFLTYKSGVYTKGDEVAKFQGFHGVKIIGWGVENGSEHEPNSGNKYWLIQNSWGEDWGEHGYAKVSMGQELMFDQYAYSLKVPSDKVEQKKKPEAAKTTAPKVEAPVEENLNLEDVPDEKEKKNDL